MEQIKLEVVNIVEKNREKCHFNNESKENIVIDAANAASAKLSK